MIYYGLLQYGYGKEAKTIRDEVITLVRKEGYREYYHPFTGEGLGGNNFSWTAALVLDLLLVTTCLPVDFVSIWP
jgi:hypothetical protein